MELIEVNALREYNYKVPGGKLVRVKMELDDENITSIQILGDFFLHPEETIYTIEESLLGSKLSRKDLLRGINSVMKEASAELIGATPEDIVNAILKAASRGG